MRNLVYKLPFIKLRTLRKKTGLGLWIKKFSVGHINMKHIKDVK